LTMVSAGTLELAKSAGNKVVPGNLTINGGTVPEPPKHRSLAGIGRDRGLV